MPRTKRRSRLSKILSDDESPEDTPKKRIIEKSKSKLYDKISKAVPTSKRPEVDPESFFGSNPVESTILPTKSPKKRKHKERDNLNAKDSESILSDTSESSPKNKNLKNRLKDEPKPHDSRPKFIQALQREPPRLLGTRSLPEGAKNCLEGLTFVISGILEFCERNEATSLVQRYGGRVTSAVSRKTSYLITGREPGESKLEKVREIGTPTLDEEAFYRLISDTKNMDEESLSEEEAVVLESPAKPVRPVGSELWVDKYKPKSLSSIVGQHGAKSPANKLLNWLLSWSKNRRSKGKKNFFAAKEDGSLFKAALLSGQPGVGKTTTALLACRELGLDIVELNASDTRSKKCLDAMLSASLQNVRISGEPTINKSVLIMDEVDGMSGNEDRGGVQELIQLIKTSRVPVICICNDRMHQKIRSLANHCFDLRFPKPRVEQLKAHIQDIASMEGFNIEPQAVEQIVIISHNDVRLVLNNLQMWSASTHNLRFDEARKEANASKKDAKENIFEVVRKLFTRSIASKMTVNEKLDMFFVDYSLMSLFAQENYLISTTAETGIQLLRNLSRVSDSISLGALCENLIRSTNNWSLLPTQGIFSCVLTSSLMSGAILGPVRFPQFLGKFSTQNKTKNILKELVFHTQLNLRATKNALILDYLPYLNSFLYSPLIEDETDGLNEVTARMVALDLTREDWDSIVELYQWSSLKLQPLVTKVKSAFTRSFNKIDHKHPYSFSTISKSRQKKELNLEDESDGDESSVEEKEEDKMVKIVSTPVQKPSRAKSSRKVKT